MFFVANVVYPVEDLEHFVDYTDLRMPFLKHLFPVQKVTVTFTRDTHDKHLSSRNHHPRKKIRYRFYPGKNE